jgi:hypothetical protein
VNAAIIGARLHAVNDDLASARMALDLDQPSQAKTLVKAAQARILEVLHEALLEAQDGAPDVATHADAPDWSDVDDLLDDPTGYRERASEAARREVDAALARAGRTDEVSRLVDGMNAVAARAVLPARDGSAIEGPSSWRGPTPFLALVAAGVVVSVLIVALVLLGGFR